MKNLSRLPNDPEERAEALRPIVARYAAQGIHDTVYHRFLREAEAEAAVTEQGPQADEEE